MLDLRGDRAVYLAGAVRTPIGRFGGGLASLSAPDLGCVALEGALAASGLDGAAVEQTIFGHGRQAGAGPNPARQVAVRAGVPVGSPAFTVNQACASGLKALLLGAQNIRLGSAEVVACGGMESMSNTPYLVPAARWGARLGHVDLVDGMYRDGFLCPLSGDLMGRTAERLAEQYAIGRLEQDQFAVQSQERAAAAIAAGAFEAEIVPVEVTGRKGTSVIDRDEHPRAGSTVESMARLEPVFKEDGTVHPGNSSGITDGAAAMILLSEEAVARYGVKPQARLLAATEAGVDPAVMGIGPVPSVEELLAGTGLGLEDIDLIELNEAFAAQVLAVCRDLNLDPSRVNVDGGAIALGHPIGATGARLVTTLVHALGRRDGKRGMVTLCVSGGMGVSLLLERCA